MTNEVLVDIGYGCVQVQVYSERRMESPLTAAGVDSIGFFDLSPLPNRSEVLLTYNTLPYT